MLLEDLTNQLLKHAATDPADLLLIGRATNVPQLAQQELDRRIGCFLGELDDEVLQAIVTGHLDFGALCLETLVRVATR